MGGRVMRAFFRHFIHSLRYITTRPLAWLVVPATACLSLVMLAVFAQASWAARQELGLTLEYAALMSLTLVWYALVAAILPCTHQAPTSARGGWAMPALPISPRVRVLAEVTAALALVLAVRVPLTIRILLSLWATQHFHPPSVLLLALRIAPSWDLILGLPLLAAYVDSRKTRPYYVARLLGVYAIAFAGLVAALLTGHVQATLLPLMALLSVAVLYSVGREPSWNLAQRQWSPSMPLHRPALEPERRLRTDILWREIPLLGVVLGAALLPGLMLALVAIAHGVAPPPGVQGRAWAPDTYLAVLSTLFATWLAVAAGTLFPLRLPLVTNTQELFVGRYCASWASLPVRPEVIRRLVYVHALLAPLLLATGFVLSKALVRACTGRAHELPSLEWLPAGRSVLAWGFVAACWAGLALCVAVGDRVRGILAAIGVCLSLYWLSDENRRLVLALSVGVAGLLAALPLVHLRRPRRLA
jgi:hypothetical protein